MSLLFGYSSSSSDLKNIEEDLDMNENRIIDLPNPVEDDEPAARKVIRVIRVILDRRGRKVIEVMSGRKVRKAIGVISDRKDRKAIEVVSGRKDRKVIRAMLVIPVREGRKGKKEILEIRE